MSATESTPPPIGSVVRRVWRAPREHGSAVIDPPWTEARSTLERNREAVTHWSASPFVSSWDDWRATCRAECLAAARHYTAKVLEVELPATCEGPLIVAGHQPELFHPGVWAKNVAIGQLADLTGGTALQLIVDNDSSAQTGIQVPVGTIEHPDLNPEPFDAPRAQQPWESTAIQDPVLFASFGDRVAARMAKWGIDPVIQQAWPGAVTLVRQGRDMVAALTAARVHIERRWGFKNLELPLSQVCQLPSFLAFAAVIFRELPEFSRHHNAVLHEYRRLNRIRSRAHPVPELGRDGDWWEAPFWVWREGDVQRDRLWVRRAGNRFELRGLGEVLTSWTTRSLDETTSTIEALTSLNQRGIRFRSRALTTTLYARLGLADLFVHGLGGAKYDEMTDALMTRFFRVPPPKFLTISATLHLPLKRNRPQDAPALSELRHRLRDMLQNPQRYLPPSTSPPMQQLLYDREQVLKKLASTDDSPRRKQRITRRGDYVRLREIVNELAAGLSPEIEKLETAIRRAEAQQTTDRLLQSREFSWTLFPEPVLRSTFESLFPLVGRPETNS